MRPAPAVRSAPPSPGAVMARATRENFPVASRLLPRNTRRHLLAIYGFARLVDDIGDEAAGDRVALLDWLEGEVDRTYAGTPTHPLMQRLVPTVRRFQIPRQPFDRLIAANRQDQEVRTYASFDDLVAYCELSANPVGHLVLYVLGAATPKRMALSDSVCTGLQLVEHWQDVAEDLARRRVYLPQEDLERFGCPVEGLGASRPSRAFRRLMAFEVGRAGTILDEGAPLARDLGGRAGFAVAAFVAGGRSALGAIARAGYDVLSVRPRPSRARRAWTLVRTLAGLRSSHRPASTSGNSR
ncbi:MAG: squalene synthase HpnC [Actinobacteria bacterium]|nr:MAG: squalene synthase HpnC [Actinomycetota bacterium]